MKGRFDHTIEFFDRVGRVRWYIDLLERFEEFVGLCSEDSVLDVNCGAGVFTRIAAKSAGEVVGVDASEAMVRKAGALAKKGRLKNVVYGVGDADEIPYADGEFDVAVSVGTAFLSPDPGESLAELARVVRPGGLVASLDPGIEMRSEKVIMFANKTGVTGFDFEALFGWFSAASRTYRFSVSDYQRFYKRLGLIELEAREEMEAMVVFSKGRKPAS